MHTHRQPPSRLALALACLVSLAACSGGNGGSYNPPGGNGNGYGNGYGNQCAIGTNVTLANPTQNAYGVSTAIGSITIVASGNSNNLYQTYPSWSIVLQGTYDTINGSQLALVADPSGPHPYPTDFYYSSSVPALPSGESFSVLLVNNSGFCNAQQIGQFST